VKSFKSFLKEQEGQPQWKAEQLAKQWLGVSRIARRHAIPPADLEKVKEIAHKFVDSAEGPWVVSFHKGGNVAFVKLSAPKDFYEDPTYFTVQDKDKKEDEHEPA
jgi:hypothetical protein